MKKYIALIFAALVSINSFAAEKTTVPVIWPFSMASVQSVYIREILMEANRSQEKYTFVLDNRPGAGGEISAVHVKQQKELTVLISAGSFFVRPNLYSTAKYSPADFKAVQVLTLVQPALVSANDKTFEQIMSKSNISIGTPGTGTLIHLLALQIKAQHPDKNITLVPYKGTPEAVNDVLGGHIDMAFEFLGDAEQRGVKIVGISGSAKIKNYALLKDIGYPSLGNAVGVYFVAVNNAVSDDVRTELFKIFDAAEKLPKVQELYQSDYSAKPAPLPKNIADIDKWYAQTIKSYEKLTQGQRVE